MMNIPPKPSEGKDWHWLGFNVYPWQPEPSDMYWFPDPPRAEAFLATEKMRIYSQMKTGAAYWSFYIHEDLLR